MFSQVFLFLNKDWKNPLQIHRFHYLKIKSCEDCKDFIIYCILTIAHLFMTLDIVNYIWMFLDITFEPAFDVNI